MLCIRSPDVNKLPRYDTNGPNVCDAARGPLLTQCPPYTCPSSQLCNLYENDCIFDKFECAVSGDASNVLTGSYSNMCHMYDRYGQAMGSLEVRILHTY